MDVAAAGAEVQDRIAHDLPRAVVRDVAAPTRLEDLDPPTAQLVLGQKQVLAPRVAAERDDGVVLEEQERVGYRLPLALLDEAGLQIESVGIGDAPETADHERRGRGALERRAHCIAKRTARVEKTSAGTVRARTRRTPAAPS
jgi:hypothetical protein